MVLFCVFPKRNIFKFLVAFFSDATQLFTKAP